MDYPVRRDARNLSYTFANKIVRKRNLRKNAHKHTMISVIDATAIIQAHLLRLPAETTPLDMATGRILREPVTADRDFPPFDRVTMDGIAFRYEAFAAGQRTFRIEGTQFAGQPQQTLQHPDACWEVMTGAMLPVGADTVIRYEDIKTAGGQATIQVDNLTAGQNIHRQGVDRRSGDGLIQVGQLMQPAHIAVAATVGKATVETTRLPRVALISTGDELVGVGETPLPHQIRQSNTWMIRAVLAGMGIQASLHHIHDDRQTLTDELGKLLAENDLLILSGGVSAGKADFVPDVLTALGVQRHFHQVAQRPGKPLWFGSTAGDQQVVFALPGNPVSTTMCVYRYIVPHLRASVGLPAAPALTAALARDFTFKPPLTFFLPVSLAVAADGKLTAEPLPGSGSGDFANLMDAGAFLELPADRSDFAQGEALPVWRF